MFRQLLEYAVNSQLPYISGHVTDGSSTFTFAVNDNQSVTVPVDSNGNWKWVQDREITSLKEAFRYIDNLDSIAFVGINLTVIKSFAFAFRQETPVQTYRVVDMSKCKGSMTITLDYVFYRSKTMWYMPNIDIALSSLTLQSWSDVRACGYIKANINFGNLSLLSKDGVISLIEHVAQNGVIITLHSTVYNKCASGGEWYSDIQTAIDAKAQQGYTVALISA